MSRVEQVLPSSVAVPAEQWTRELERLRRCGHTYFDFLAATDLGEGDVEVVVHLMTPDAADRVLVRTAVPAGQALASLAGLFPAAVWHEREAHEFVGLAFDGNPGLDPLLLPAGSGHPLRRSWPLRARLDAVWPGAGEPATQADASAAATGGRTRPTPGVSASWLALDAVSEVTDD
ncbi:MAG: NADH-quinone oxidoreductase subunit C [Actinomycetes bacterium]